MSRAQLRILILAVIVAIAVAPSVLGPFNVILLNYIGIYALVATGLVLLTGVVGIVSFGQAAFVGVAAYSTAWVTVLHGGSPWVGLVLALVLTCVVAAILGVATLRLKGHFLSLSTIAWGLSIGSLFGNLDGLGRYNGISNIPSLSVGGVTLTEAWQSYYVIWGVLIALLLLLNNLLNSRLGRAMRTLRGGTMLAESLGVNAFNVRLITFVMAAFLAGLAGWLYAHMSRFISPTPFEAHASIDYLMMAIIGGSGSLLGGVVGAGLITLIRNGLQDYLGLIMKGAAGQLQTVAFAIVFILFLQRARQGIATFIVRFIPKVRVPLTIGATPLPRRNQPQPGTPLLKVDQIVKRFGGLIAVNKVSFEVRAGEILGLIGPNGAGKSTTFNLLTGALRIDSGNVEFAGETITGKSQRQIARAGIARTFQHVKLRPNMTLLDNVLLGTYPRTRSGLFRGLLRLDRAEEASARQEALKQLGRLGLGENPFELAGNLPLGKQRVLEIARALAADPRLLVLDEPAAGLRKQEKHHLAQLLTSLRAEHLTILIVEHDMEFVMGLVDRIVVMDFGSKLCEGKPSAVRSDPKVQEAYLGGIDS